MFGFLGPNGAGTSTTIRRGDELDDVPRNHLVTGPPRSGKTTVLRRVRDDLDRTPGGVLAPERRVAGDRVGFDLVDVQTGDRVNMASVDRDTGPGVGKYRVDVGAVDRLVDRALSAVGVDYWLVDEVAPMQTRSDRFVRGVRDLLDGPDPVVAAVHYQASEGFAAETRSRGDATLYDLTTSSVDETVAAITDAVGPTD